MLASCRKYSNKSQQFHLQDELRDLINKCNVEPYVGQKKMPG